MPYRVYSVTLEAPDGHIYGRPVYATTRHRAIQAAVKITREEYDLSDCTPFEVLHIAPSRGLIALDA